MIGIKTDFIDVNICRIIQRTINYGITPLLLLIWIKLLLLIVKNRISLLEIHWQRCSMCEVDGLS